MKILTKLALSILSVTLLFSSGRANASEVAITLDDLPIWESDVAQGYDRVGTSVRIVDVISDFVRRQKMPVPYGFVNATQITETRSTDKVLDAWKAAGFLLGNHTFSHPHLRQTSIADFEKDILKDEETLKRHASPEEFHVFRYPFLDEGKGSRKHRAIREFLKQKGYEVAEVTIDFNDWAYNDAYVRCINQKNGKKASEIKAAYLRAAEEQLKYQRQLSSQLFGREVKHILLLHMSQINSEILPELFSLYQKLGARWISLREAMSDPLYELAGASVRSGLFVEKIAQDRGVDLKRVRVGADDPVAQNACR